MSEITLSPVAYSIIDEALRAFESDIDYTILIAESVAHKNRVSPAQNAPRLPRPRPVRERPAPPVRIQPLYEFPVATRLIEPTMVLPPEPTEEEWREMKARQRAVPRSTSSRSEMTPEQVEAARARARDRKARRFAAMSPEEREQHKEKARIKARAYYEANQEEFKEKARQRYYQRKAEAAP